MADRPIRVMCVDDNLFVTESLERVVEGKPGLAWAGCARDAVELVARVDAAAADVVILDVDMPVRDTMEALAELTRLRPNVRVVMLSGHVRRDLIERALDKGAMGYISKIEEPGVIIEAVRAAARGEIALSPESQRALARG